MRTGNFLRFYLDDDVILAIVYVVELIAPMICHGLARDHTAKNAVENDIKDLWGGLAVFTFTNFEVSEHKVAAAHLPVDGDRQRQRDNDCPNRTTFDDEDC